MKLHKIFLIIIITAFMQMILPVILPGYSLLHVEWTLLGVVLISLRTRLYSSMRVGIFAGLLLDIFSGGRLGVFGLSFMIAALSISSIRPWTDQGNLLGACILTFAASFIVGTINFILLDMFGNYPGYFSYMLWFRILPQAAVNTLFAVPVYLLFNKEKPRRRKYRRI
jgi:rod shape-determining protein MreD